MNGRQTIKQLKKQKKLDRPSIGRSSIIYEQKKNRIFKIFRS